MQLAREELGIEWVEKSIARTELYNADEVFFSGTAMEVAPVVEVDDIKVAHGRPGGLTMKLKDFSTTWLMARMKSTRTHLDQFMANNFKFNWR